MHVPAVDILRRLGVSDPAHIDLAAIAWDEGAEIRYATLVGCEARIVGNGARAIITVEKSVHPHRARFSVAHELGHWHHHRGRLVYCLAGEIGRSSESLELERMANRFAAELLMPEYLFLPRLQQSHELSWRTVERLAKEFFVSPVAAAIRCMTLDQHSAVLVRYSRNGAKQYTKSKTLDHLHLRRELDARSPAFGVLFGAEPDDRPHRVPGTYWFAEGPSTPESVVEHSVATPEGAYTLVTVPKGRRT